MEVLCFFAGTAFVLYRHVYPLALLLIALGFRLQYRYPVWFVAGAFWAIAHQLWISDKGMPAQIVIKHAQVSGYVQSIPKRQNQTSQFYFKITSFNGLPAHATVLLSCYQRCPKTSVGESAQVVANIKRPKNLQNPGSYNFERWLNVRHIRWIAQMRPNTWRTLPDKKVYQFLLQLRERLIYRLRSLTLDKQTLGILQALTVGISEEIGTKDWGLFRRTGTIHLMVISGAHIGLIAGISYWLSRRFLTFFPSWCIRFPAQQIASIVAMSIATFYALIAGFAIPAQRALIVCLFMFARYFAKQRFSAWQAWRYALLTVLVMEPHSVLMPGFYLSFIAVAVLLSVNRRIDLKGVPKTFVIQLGCLLGLLPLTHYTGFPMLQLMVFLQI